MARNHALNQRTTVYMVFVPLLVALDKGGFSAEEQRQLTNRIPGQLTSYNFVTMHSPGDQPGQGTMRYLSDWKHLPDGVCIPTNKMTQLPPATWQNLASTPGATNLPFPQIRMRFPGLKGPTNPVPCIAFNYKGELLGPIKGRPRGVDEFVRLTRGSVIYPRGGSDQWIIGLPETIETPRGNATNNPYIRIDWITGRARIEEPTI